MAMPVKGIHPHADAVRTIAEYMLWWLNLDYVESVRLKISRSWHGEGEDFSLLFSIETHDGHKWDKGTRTTDKRHHLISIPGDPSNGKAADVVADSIADRVYAYVQEAVRHQARRERVYYTGPIKKADFE